VNEAPAASAAGAVGALERTNLWLQRALAAAAGVALAALMAFTAFDVLMRALGRPVAGSVEIVGWLAAVAMALALGDVQVNRGHVAVTLVSERLKGRRAALLEAINSLVALLLFGMASVVILRYGATLQQTGSLSETLKVVVYPWVYVVAIGFAGLTLALLVDLLRSLQKLRPSAASAA
jgi:TRAP-type C4-dicarboxylate transport system permease small subunit